ncbi:MAG: recombination regulator RecX [Oscillospiraceae bacterium]|jgi:SOS response regulatory protein OraA/RecX|nr:recombination regulator RecX [Oscillospiraceae bacterium]
MELSRDFDKAKNHALKFLSYRDHCGGELLKKLGRYYERETCLAALEWVREAGYQDDEKYAEKFAAVLIETKRYGVRKARYEMKLKGLSDESVKNALEPYGDDEITDIITELIRRKYADCLEDRQGIKKTADALMRRGYDYSDIKTAIAKVKEDIELDCD